MVSNEAMSNFGKETPGVTLDSVTVFFVSVFFFQAEDGIRDLTVTGVQTCALPICDRPARAVVPVPAGAARAAQRQARADRLRRSEERRVGKECRSRWAPEP